MRIFHYNILAIGVWRSLVSRMVRVHEAAGSNPATPTREKTVVSLETAVFSNFSVLFMAPYHCVSTTFLPLPN